MVCHFFAMSEKDQSMTDIAQLHKVNLQSGDIQQFVCKWDEILSLVSKTKSLALPRPPHRAL